jgi:chaperone BCS1
MQKMQTFADSSQVLYGAIYFFSLDLFFLGTQLSWVLFRRHYMTTVEVTCKDKSYNWLLHWMTKSGARETQHLSVDTSFVETESGKISTKYDFQPSVGTHFMQYNGTWIKVR